MSDNGEGRGKKSLKMGDVIYGQSLLRVSMRPVYVLTYVVYWKNLKQQQFDRKIGGSVWTDYHCSPACRIYNL